MVKRSAFLAGTFAGLTVASMRKGVFANALAQAPLPGISGDTKDRVLVVINLQGGNDGLNTLVPHGSPAYYKYRPTLAVPAGDVLRIDQNVGLNPKMGSLKSMYDAGNVAIVQGVGYPDPNHSHFRSTEIWQTAAPATFENTGWIGRYLDTAQLPDDDLFGAVALAPLLPAVMVGRSVDVPVIANLRGYSLSSDGNSSQRGSFAAMDQASKMPFNSPYLGTVAMIEDHAQRGSEELPKLIAGYKTDAAYPNSPLSHSLALAAQMIGSRLGTRVIYVHLDQFDTHASQKETHDRILGELSDALKAFYDDLAAHGNDKRVLTMTFSEFGRRVAENGSRGTDHGEAAPMFLVGGGIKGGLYGQAPNMDALDANGDVTFTTDFRSVYATVIEKWFGRPSTGIIAGNFATLPLLA